MWRSAVSPVQQRSHTYVRRNSSALTRAPPADGLSEAEGYAVEHDQSWYGYDADDTHDV
jgi:hypothetical protein